MSKASMPSLRLNAKSAIEQTPSDFDTIAGLCAFRYIGMALKLDKYKSIRPQGRQCLSLAS